MIGDSHLVIAKIDKFPPIPVAKIHGNPNAHPNTMKNLEQKYGKQNITIVAIDKKCDVPNVWQQSQPLTKTITKKMISNADNLHYSMDGHHINNCIVDIFCFGIGWDCKFSRCIFTNCKFYVRNRNDLTLDEIVSYVFCDCVFSEPPILLTTHIGVPRGDPRLDRPIL